MSIDVAIIGDRFMRSEVFAAAIRQACGDAVRPRLVDLPWPDVPMEHGYAVNGLDGLKEYMGDPDEVVGFVGGAAVLVTHLAPLSAGMVARLPDLKLVAVSRARVPYVSDLPAPRAD